MQSVCYKILCFLLALSLIAGIAVGCQDNPETQPGTTLPTNPTTGTTGTTATTCLPTTRPTTAPTTVPTTVPTTAPTTAPTVPTTAPTAPTTAPTVPTVPTIPTVPTVPTMPTMPPFPTVPTIPTVPTEPTEPWPTYPPVENVPQLHGTHAFMFDTRTQQFLYRSGAEDTSWYPASTTKMYTAYIALQYLPVDYVITVGDELDLVSNDTSRAYFQKGDVLTVMDLLYGLFLPSGCDAAYILAVYTTRVMYRDYSIPAADAAAAFAAEMNRLAQELGMVNTNFVTVDGYHHPDHYISMQAYTIIAQLCLSNPNITKVSNTYAKDLRVKNIDGTSRTLYLRNTNKLVCRNSRYYNSAVIGLKTGSHSKAGANLIAAYKVDGGYIIIGLLGYFGDWDLRFQDANALFNIYKQMEEAYNTPATPQACFFKYST